MRISDWSSDVCSSDLHEASSDWLRITSKDYPNHPSMIANDRRDVESMLASDGLWVGTPDDICEKITRYQKAVGGIESASLPVKFHNRSEERRVGKECVRPFKSRWSPHI